MVDQAAAKIDGFHPLLRMILMHAILSHHGEKEFGAPKRPKSLESVILHYLEDMDAKVQILTEAVDARSGDGDSEIWTERHWLLDRPFLKGLPDAALGRTEGLGLEPTPDGNGEDAADDDPFAD